MFCPRCPLVELHWSHHSASRAAEPLSLGIHPGLTLKDHQPHTVTRMVTWECVSSPRLCHTSTRLDSSTACYALRSTHGSSL